MRLRLRRAPELAFTYDESVERGERIEQLLEEIRAAGASSPDESTPSEPDPSDQ